MTEPVKDAESAKQAKFAEVGALISNMQRAELAVDDKSILNMVRRHPCAVVLLKVCSLPGSKAAPLDFVVRMRMIHEYDPTIVVLPLLDVRDVTEWSRQVDRQIRTAFPFGAVQLYVKKASLYNGQFNIFQIYEAQRDMSEWRNKGAENPVFDASFRKGMIYHAQHKWTRVSPVVDIIPITADGHLVVGRKDKKGLLCLIGGFVDPQDPSYEDAASRELREEASIGADPASLQYITSRDIPDWRLRKHPETMKSALFTVEISHEQAVAAQAGDDLVQLVFIDPLDFDLSTVVQWHRYALQLVIDRILDEKTVDKPSESSDDSIVKTKSSKEKK
tara:strand:+ start:1440 stop:2438 length:999 start_codon:yes stop_codon:yes gene_type:complete